jgi:hypothetical protein
MTAERLFSIANLVALTGWVALVALPARRWVDALAGRLLPASLAVAYVVILAANWGAGEGGFSSLAGVAQLFENSWLLLAGWIHYLAFDLFIGSWIARDARRHGIRHLLVVPCFALTFLFGPAGLLTYLALRASLGAAGRGRSSHGATSSAGATENRSSGQPSEHHS